MSARFASAVSTAAELSSAIDEVCQTCGTTSWPSVDLAVVFVTHDHADDWSTIAGRICDALQADCLIGCSAESVVGPRQEIEEGPGLALWAAHLPNVDVVTVRLQFENTPEGAAIVGWPDQILESWPTDASLLLLADPFTFPADYLLEQLNEDHPGVAVLGGMASGGTRPGEHRLFVGREAFESGAVGCFISGEIRVDSLVSQGCRPIGPTFVITAAEQNLVKQLGGKPALEQLQQLFLELPAREQELCQRGLHLGRVVSEYQERFEMGDFLIRNVLGFDREAQAIAVGDYFRPGQTVQFHLRDGDTASMELEQMLQRYGQNSRPTGALLFTCNGRGTRMFRDPHHDAGKIASQFGNLPLAGFFAQGELGPVGGHNFVHGFTASMALFAAK